MILIWVFLMITIVSAVANSPSVLIIGAGPSGIAAATKLLENGITNITILEAENRIGGRIYSIALEDGYIDVGAEFCHGEIGNVVFESVKNLSLLNREDLSADLYYSDGSKIDDELAEDLWKFTKSDFGTKNNSNLGESAMELFNLTLLPKYSTLRKPNIVEDLPRLLEHMFISLEGAFSWNTPIANGHYETAPGNQELTWKTGGYHTILNVLMKKIPNSENQLPLEDKVFLNKEVTGILWKDDKAIIKTVDTEYSADYVIFTPSIGVLKHNNRLFTPPLPKNKIDALDALGFDAVIKINVHYLQKWWNQSAFLVWSANDLFNSAKEFPHGYQKNGISWITSIYAFSQAANPNVLVAWVTGSLVPKIEQISEETIKDGIFFVAQKFFGKQFNVSKPDRVIRSQWYSNPHFYGTYSYEKSSHFRKDISNQAILAEPLHKKNGDIVVQFAGEATHSTHFSTVHGAIETGWREAQRIISLTQRI